MWDWRQGCWRLAGECSHLSRLRPLRQTTREHDPGRHRHQTLGFSFDRGNERLFTQTAPSETRNLVHASGPVHSNIKTNLVVHHGRRLACGVTSVIPASRSAHVPAYWRCPVP